MLEIDSLTKRFQPLPRLLRLVATTATTEPVDALRGVTMRVDRGEIVGLVGPNGAGKTTLLKIVSTLLEPTSGTARVDGIDVTRDPTGVKGRLGIVLSEERGFYWRLDGRRNLELFGVLAGLPRESARARATELLELFDLDGRDKRVFGYSSGMRARLGLARALLNEPALLVLDEPSRSLDPVASTEFGRLLRDTAAEGRAVLLSSHRLDEVVSVCDRVVILVGGSVRFAGPLGLLEHTDGPAARIVELLERESEHP